MGKEGAKSCMTTSSTPLARRVGVKRNYFSSTRRPLDILDDVIRDAVTFTEHVKLKTFTVMDVSTLRIRWINASKLQPTISTTKPHHSFKQFR